MYSNYYAQFTPRQRRQSQPDLLAELERKAEERQRQQQNNNTSNASDLWKRFSNKPATGASGSLYGSGAGTTSALNSAGMADYGAMSTSSVLAGEGGVAGTGYAGGAGAGAGVGGGAGGGGSSLAGAGPWGALAAIIAINEREAKRGGYRSEDDSDYYNDLLFGKAAEQDVHKRWYKLPDKWLGDENDSLGLGSGMKAFTNLTTGDFNNALHDNDDFASKPWKKLRDIFS